VSFFAEIDGRRLRVVPRATARGTELEIDGVRTIASLEPLDANDPARELALSIDGRSERVLVAARGDRVFVHARGRSFEVRFESELEGARASARARAGSGAVSAPMPGVVVELLVREGDEVEAGRTLLVIESMKLQSRIASEVAGRVAEICVAPGQSFERGAVLARIECAPRGAQERA